MNAKPRHRAGLFYLRYAAHRTHYLGPFGQRADIALPSHCQPVAGFFIPGPGKHPRHAYLLNRPEGLTPFKHTAPAFKPEVRDYENA